MKCEKYYDLISLYIDDMLSESEKSELETHLEQCSSCQEELDTLNLITRDLTNIDMVKPPKDFHSDLMQQIREVNNKKKKSSFYKTWSSLAVVAAALLIVIIPKKLDTNFIKDQTNQESYETKEISPINTRTFTAISNNLVLEIETSSYKEIKEKILELLNNNEIKEDVFQETIRASDNLKKLVIEFSVNDNLDNTFIDNFNKIIEDTNSSILYEKQFIVDNTTKKITLDIQEIK